MAIDKEALKKEDFNCAEGSIRIANEKYNLQISEESMKLLAAYGGGMGCGKTCGALLADLAALSYMTVGHRAHQTEGFKDRNAAFVQAFSEKFGGIDCAEIKGKYAECPFKCLQLVEEASELLDSFVADLKK